MKKIFTCILAVVYSCGFVSADRARIGKFYYNLDSSTNTAEVTYEEGYGINNYSYLNNAVIPSSVKRDGVNYTVTNIGYVAFYNSSNLISIEIPNSVTIIGTQAFQNCTHLASINIPNSISIIAGFAFTACSSITSIDIPYGTTTMGENVFNGCTSLKKVTIPSTITNIPGWAFVNCPNLDSISIPDSVTEIGYAAFALDSSLSYVQLPKFLTSIGGYAFESCALSSVNIPDSVREIKMSAFVNCKNLKTIRIPNATIIIDAKAFSGCNNLDTITNYAKTPQKIRADVFDGVNKQTCILYVPNESIDLYREANVWREFFNILPIDATLANDELVSNNSCTVKYIKNGQIYINSKDKIYTVTGIEIK